jgi:transposase-like protein
MVVFYHENGHSIRATANKYEIEPKQVRDWKNKKTNLMCAAPYVQKLNIGARPKYLQLEEELLEWVRDLRRQLKTVTRYMIGAKARSLAHKQEYRSLYPDIHKCQFSHKWVDGFMSRHSLVNRRRTTVAQRLPEEYNEQQQNFLSYLLYLRTEHDYPLNLIGNMDETPMAFNLPSQTTIEERGKRTVSILTTGHERTHFTVTLACLADGTKLPPLIIFKLVKVPREQFPDGIYVHANPTGWMDEKEMIWWVENVWCRKANLGSNLRSLLILDSFIAHRTDPVKRRFKEKNTDMAVILGGLTSRLQPLDVSLNKAFKAKVVRCYEFKINIICEY